MKKILIGLLLILTVSITSSCTSNSRAKNFGGSMNIELEAGEKLIEATWKNDDLWLLTRQRRENETIETYKFSEDSSFGVWEGVITIKEK